MTPRRIVVGLALLALMAGLVAAYHPRRDPVLRTVALDQYSSMLVVNPRTARAFVGDGSRVHVLDTATGALLRTVTVAPSRARVDHLAVAEQVGRVVVLGDSFSGSPPLVGYVSVLDAYSGRLLHTTPVSMGNISWLAVDAQARRAVVVSLPDYMRAGTVPDPVRDPVRVSVLDAASGRLVRAVLLSLPQRPLSDWYFPGSPVAINGRTGRIVVSRCDGARVSVLDAATGRVIRTVVLQHRQNAPAIVTTFALVVDERTNRVFVSDSLRGTMSVLDASSGRLLRTTRLPVSGNPSAPLLDMRSGRVFVLDGAGLAVLDATSGRLLHTVAVPSRPGMSPALDLAVDEHSGRVFAVAPDVGMVRVLDGWSGQVLRTVRLATDLAGLAIDSRRGHLIITAPGVGDRAIAPPGHVMVLDGRTGALLRSVMVGSAPVSVAVDETTDHVVVLTSGGRVPVPDPWSWLPPKLRRRLPFLPPRPSTWRTVPPGVRVLDAT